MYNTYLVKNYTSDKLPKKYDIDIVKILNKWAKLNYFIWNKIIQFILLFVIVLFEILPAGKFHAKKHYKKNPFHTKLTERNN